MIECKDNSIYTGQTNNLKRRYNEHRTGKGARYTKRKGVKRLLGFKAYRTRSKAMKEEYRIKRDLSHREKRELAERWRDSRA